MHYNLLCGVLSGKMKLHSLDRTAFTLTVHAALSGECYLLILLDVTLATHCHTHYHLHLFQNVLFKCKDLVAKQHLTNILTVL